MMVRGRPMKYTQFIKELDLETTYGTATVVEYGEARGLFKMPEHLEDCNSLEEARVRVRTAINRIAMSQLPKKPDDCIVQERKLPMRAWFGWRWKMAIPEIFFDEIELKEIKDCETRFLQNVLEQKKAAKRRIWTRVFGFRKVRLALLFLFGAVLLTAGFITAFYPEGVRVFKEEGPTAALNYFRGSETFKRRDPVVVFGQAWSNFAIGNYDEAEQEAYRLIKDPNTPEVTVGNCFFLLGKIKTRTGPYHEAREHLYKAIDIFEILDRPANLYKAYASLAALNLILDELAEAGTHIDAALEVNERANMDLGEILHLQAELAFLQQDYQRALECSYRCYSARKKASNQPEMADALVDIAFYLILTGQEEMAFEKAMEALLLINKIGAKHKMYYNLINLIFLRRCEGRSYAGLESELLNYIDEQGDQNLQRLMNFVLNFPCGHTGPEEGGEGDTTPPPNGE